MKHRLLAGFIPLAVLIFLCRSLPAEIVLKESEKARVAFFGFLKVDMAYQDGGMNGLTISRYAAPGSANIFLTPQHSRFGLKVGGASLASGYKLDALLEWDLLDPASPNQMKIRTRQAALSLQKGRSTWLVGQSWDVFSPLGPTTLMTNGYLWQVGNLGFRHAQVRYTYTGLRADIAVSLGDPGSSAGWRSKTPVLQARLGGKLGRDGRFQVGLSGLYGRELLEGDPVQNPVGILGLGLDWSLPFTSALTLKGEYALGKNLAYAMSRATTFQDVETGAPRGKSVHSLWSQLVYTRAKATLWLGYSFEDLPQVSQLAAEELKWTSCLLAGGQYHLGSGFSLGAEAAHFHSRHHLGNVYRANQLLFSAIFNF